MNNSLDKQVLNLSKILENDDLQAYSGELFWSLIESVVSADTLSGVKAANSIKNIVFHMPTFLFWEKMRRFLFGTFRSYEDQVKMAEKFNQDHSKYSAFVKQMIHLINEIDFDAKVDFFAALSRSFLLTDLNEDLYFKLAKIISNSTIHELNYIKNQPYSFTSSINIMISLLYNSGLFSQKEEADGRLVYVFSDLAKALKQNSLNFDDGLCGTTRICGYDNLTPLQIPESMTWVDIDEIIQKHAETAEK